MNKNDFPNEYDDYERGITAKHKPTKRLNTEGAFCPECHIVMVPGGGCFTCPACGGSNAKCGG